MKFRPCIDLHNGKVKQIVGSTLTDTTDSALKTNFETEKPSEEFAAMYQVSEIGDSVIQLSRCDSLALTIFFFSLRARMFVLFCPYSISLVFDSLAFC